MNYPPEFYLAISSGFVFLTKLADIALHYVRHKLPVQQ